ncbi:LytTR family DNA-binding domain-containing protein [Paenibacillus pini]|uniref:HTH LytTR-type domain-containing protein n=1 Tax=Paenibacillus pini JCM 16418 TaxID=1236976 RepID=W7YND9_9BACL|nr:LytTR family DNA-binding domain-containing protein [Paenibacillus pini]GAF06146.1 hypothetical protein JCM16418_91 [Paenibacillus pini JCM 16418]
MLSFYPDIAIYTTKYSLIADLLPHFRNNRVFNLKNIKQLQEAASKNNGLVLILELTNNIVCQLQAIFSQLSKKESDTHLIFLCNNQIDAELLKKTIFHANTNPFFIHFSKYETLLTSIQLATKRIIEKYLAKIAEKELTTMNYLTLKYNNKNLIIIENLIKCVEKVSKNSVDITLSNNNKIQSTSNLKEIVNQSSPLLFQSHKSFLVNIKYIKSISPSECNTHLITLENELNIPLSKGFFPHFTVARNILKSIGTFN